MGRLEHCKQISLAYSHKVPATLGLARSRCVCFPSLHCSGSRLLCLELSEVGPGMRALPRSKPLWFRLLLRYSTKAQTRLDLPLVPFPGPSSSGDQVLGEHSHPQVWCVLSPPPSQLLRFLGGSRCASLRYAMCLFWGADPCCDSLGGCQPPRIPRSLGRQMGACLRFCRGCPSGAEIAPFWLWLPPPASLSPASAQPASCPVLSPMLCEWARKCLRLGLFPG